MSDQETIIPVVAGSEIEVDGSGTPMTRWRKFRMVVKVVELRLRFIALMAATGLVFGYWDLIWNHYEKWNRPPRAEVAAVDSEFYCPMHPSVVRDEPGQCPICGMPLSKRLQGEAESLPPGVLARLELAPFRIAQAGIRTSLVGYAPVAETLTTVGDVTFDERRLARIASKLKGLTRVETLHVNFTGTPVRAGEPLAELYSPELYQATQELLIAGRRSGSNLAQGGPRSSLGRSLLGEPDDLARLAREKLILWGITPEQIDQIVARGTAEYRLPILAPIGGVVVRKNVVEGQYVAEGEPLFEIADLGHVWVLARVFEDQFASVRVGQAVEATVESYPGEVFRGRVAFIDPVLDPMTRTVGVRYDLENPDHRLRPGMFATVTLRTPMADRPGFRTADASAPETPEGQGICPVTRAKLGSMGAPIPVELAERKVWICCPSCTEKLEAAPERYLARLEPAPEGAVLTVPESAVIDTGTRKVVYVEAEPGVFEGREVVLGPRTGDLYPVLSGLEPGDSVASAGAFLIDAETRLNPAAHDHAEGGEAREEQAAPKHDHETRPQRSASTVDDTIRR